MFNIPRAPNVLPFKSNNDVVTTPDLLLFEVSNRLDKQTETEFRFTRADNPDVAELLVMVV